MSRRVPLRTTIEEDVIIYHALKDYGKRLNYYFTMRHKEDIKDIKEYEKQLKKLLCSMYSQIKHNL